MQLHQIKSQTKQKAGRRIGRGGKRGTYSGRGIKGQRSRAGAKIRPSERDILKKIPKLRGYKFRAYRPRPAVVGLSEIDRRYQTGERVTPLSLLEKKLIRRSKGRIPRVKILGGKIEKQVIFEDVLFSASAAKVLNKGHHSIPL